MFSHSKILFLVPLLFLTSIPTYFLNFKFFIILVCLLFIHAKHSPTELYALSHSVIIINQFILTFQQNITGAYVIIMLVCRILLTMHLPGKAAV